MQLKLILRKFIIIVTLRHVFKFSKECINPVSHAWALPKFQKITPKPKIVEGVHSNSSVKRKIILAHGFFFFFAAMNVKLQIYIVSITVATSVKISLISIIILFFCLF